MRGRARSHVGRQALERQDASIDVGGGFITFYAISCTGESLSSWHPAGSLASKVNDLIGIDAASANLAMVTGIASLFAIVQAVCSGASATARPSGSGCGAVDPVRDTATAGMESCRRAVLVVSPTLRPIETVGGYPRQRTDRPSSSIVGTKPDQVSEHRSQR